MRFLLTLFTLFLSLNSQALNLNSGDLLLQSDNCYLCRVIEAEDQSPFSHIGLLVEDQGKWEVLESIGKVKRTPIEEFLKRRTPNTQTLVLRLDDESLLRNVDSKKLLTQFELNYEGKHYDSSYLWDNKDELGEMFYCSELIAKFLAPFMVIAIEPKPMHFMVNRDFWMKFFHGNPPDGKPGLSPGDFERSPLFKKVGTI